MTKEDITIHLLQVGEADWSTYPVAKHMEVTYLPPQDIGKYLVSDRRYKARFKEQQKRIAQLIEDSEDLPAEEEVLATPLKYTALLLTGGEYPEQLVELLSLFEVYEIFYLEDAQGLSQTMRVFLDKKMAQVCQNGDPESLLTTFSRSLFTGQYGDKLAVSQLQIVPGFRGQVRLNGQSHMILTGDFGDSFQQVAYFQYNGVYDSTKGKDLFFEHLASEGVQTKVVAQLISRGSLADVVKEWELDMMDKKRQLYIESDISGVLTVSMFAKGSGELSLGPCHFRDSRKDFGQFILGGERFVDANQQEFMYYFDPSDFKPPLCVYFSGFRTAEGFEGFWMMKNLNTPFMLICDPRIEGGSFYMGSAELEQKIVDAIQEKLDFLGFDNSQLILSGLSMGTFGAMYHGAKLSPHAIIIGKPVLSLGEVALNERLSRPWGFPTSLDLLNRYTGRLNEDGAEELDDYFWKQFTRGDFSRTTFLIAYMKNDDYDASAFRKILEVTRGTSATVIGRGWPGRHSDGGSGPVLWFLKQYQNVLENDFGRGQS